MEIKLSEIPYFAAIVESNLDALLEQEFVENVIRKRKLKISRAQVKYKEKTWYIPGVGNVTGHIPLDPEGIFTSQVEPMFDEYEEYEKNRIEEILQRHREDPDNS